MKKPGLSRERARPFKEGPLMKVASVMEARSLTFPALTEKVAPAEFLSVEYLALSEAFIIFSVEDVRNHAAILCFIGQGYSVVTFDIA